MTDTMQALVLLGPDEFEIRQVPVPEPGPMEVLCRVRAVSICGTDSHIYNWDPSMRPRIERATDGLSRSLTIGHEFCGNILQVGAKWRDKFQPGTKYSIQPAFNYPGRELEAARVVGDDIEKLIIDHEV